MVIIIAAISKNNALGKNNALIWHFPSDLQRFKKITTGYPILMGRNTFESIGKPLPNRINIIITRNKNYKKEGCKIVHSLEKGIEIAKKYTKIFIIGGAQIYKQAIEKKLVDKMEITRIHKKFEADTFFPEINPKTWEQTTCKNFKADKKNKYDYSFISYQKIK